MSSNPVQAPASTLALLRDLHAKSSEQEKHFPPKAYAAANLAENMRDKFVALDEDKCWFVYQVALASGASNIVEAGTSFGVSTIYLALAAASNAAGKKARVIGTEHKPSKAAQAREYWAQAGVSEHIDLREGDILETLTSDLGVVDMLLLDIWAPLALPVLKLVQPSLRRGAVVFADNTTSGADRYAEFLSYVRAPGSGFTSLTVPYHNGLEMCVYLGA